MFRPRPGLVCFCLFVETASVLAADPDPESVLKDHSLKPSGWVYVVESEASFHWKVIDARSRYQDWSAARARLIEQEQEAAAIQELTAESAQIQQNIAQARRQMANGSYGGRFAAQYRRIRNQEIAAEINQAQAMLDAMTQELSRLRKKAPKPLEKKGVEEEASQRRDALREAVIELRTQADKIAQTYHDLHKAKEVEQAIAAIGSRDGSKPKLGPSREYQADLKILHKLESELGSDGIRFNTRAKTLVRSKKLPTSK